MAILSITSSCTDMFRTELDETHAKLKALQELANSVNQDLTTLSEIVSKMDDSHTIDPSTLVEKEDGYEVSFRDGKKIYIHFGKDGVDGRTLIPIGVKMDKDSLYYWTVDGEWLKDADGNLMRAGATDGKDGIVPRTKIEEGKWMISVDNGKTYTVFGTVEELNGVGVFSGIDLSDPTKAVLTLIDGTVLEIPCTTTFRMSFAGPAQGTALIAGGESLSIPYEILKEGDTGQTVTVTSGTDGTYMSRIEEGSSPEKGVVIVQAPEVFSEGYILLTANCGGYSSIKMISFQERKTTPEKKSVSVRLSSGDITKTIEYSTNFDYTVTVSDGGWLKAVADPKTGKLTFTATPNSGETVRSCTVTISPKDNPGFACTTFRVLQAPGSPSSLTCDVDPDCPFIFDPQTKMFDIPVEGGDADLWITYSKELIATGLEEVEWASAELSTEDGFYRLRIHVDANKSGESREGSILLKRKDNEKEFIMGEITLIQR